MLEDESLTRLLGPNVALGLPSDEMGGDSCITTSSSPILMRTNAAAGPLLMSLFFVMSTFVRVIAKTSMPFASCAILLTWPYLRTLVASLAWLFRT